MILTETAPLVAGQLPIAAFTAHLRLSQGFDNDGSEEGLIETYLRAAIAAVEGRTGQALIARGFRLEIGAWDGAGHLTLPVGPVGAIGAMSFVGDGADVVVAVDGFCLAPGVTRQRLTAGDGGALPAIPSARTAVLTFDAGHGADWAGVPGDLAQAVYLLAARYYEDRSGADARDAGLPAPVQALLAPHRVARI